MEIEYASDFSDKEKDKIQDLINDAIRQKNVNTCKKCNKIMVTAISKDAVNVKGKLVFSCDCPKPRKINIHFTF